MKKNIVSLVLAIALTLALAACGGGDSKTIKNKVAFLIATCH